MNKAKRFVAMTVPGPVPGYFVLDRRGPAYRKVWRYGSMAEAKMAAGLMNLGEDVRNYKGKN